MKRILLLLAATAAVGLAGCQTQMAGPAVPMTGPPPGGEAFSDQDFAWSTGSGSAMVDGALAYGGGAAQFTCKDVVLIPRTPWSRRRMIILYGSDDHATVPAEEVRARTPSAPSGAYSQYVRHAACDAADHFTFSGLPDGAWFLITVATPTAGGSQVAVMRHLETHGGVKRVVLN